MSANQKAFCDHMIPWSRSYDYCDRRSRHARVGTHQRAEIHASEMISQN
jgi:hypothetical protein